MSIKTIRQLRIQRAFQLRRERHLSAIARGTTVPTNVRYGAIVMAEEFREHIDKIDARLQQLKAQAHG